TRGVLASDAARSSAGSTGVLVAGSSRNWPVRVSVMFHNRESPYPALGAAQHVCLHADRQRPLAAHTASARAREYAAILPLVAVPQTSYAEACCGFRASPPMDGTPSN